MPLKHLNRLLRRPASLQGRMLLMLLGLIVAVWLVTALQTWRDMRHELDELLDGHLAQAAALLVTQQTREIEGHHGDTDEPVVAPALDAPTLHHYAPTVAFQVFHDGELVLRSAQAPTAPMGTPWRDDPAQPGGATASTRATGGTGAGNSVSDARTASASTARGLPGEDHDDGRSTGADALHTVTLDGVAWRVFTALGAEHDIRVYVGEQLDMRDHIALAALRSMLWPLVLALPLLALAVAAAVHHGTLPLRRLGAGLASRGAQDLQPVSVADAPAEMAPMLAELNRLFGRIAELMESERRFTADAAHELRTPIAAIRMQAQVAMGEPDAAQRRHALQATLAGCDRATRLVEQLLTLSRLEAGASPALQPVDLVALTRQVLSDQAMQAVHKQQELEFDPPPPHAEPCRVAGDPTLLSVLVRNLVDNAIRYSPRQAALRIELRSSAGAVTLSVQDSGPGLSDADRARIGERFFRVLGSGEGGSGLGWSIVRRIAAVHGAEVQLDRSALLGGLAVTVTWPTAR
jgi:two-component system sensor histidine kinase QseC